MQKSVGQLIAAAARRFGDKPAIVFDDEKLSFAQVDSQSTAVARKLQALGFAKGDVISLYSPNCPEWIIVYYGVLKLGCVINPLNLMLTSSEAAFAITDCKAKAVFASREKAEGLVREADSTAIEHLIHFGTEPLECAVGFDSWIDSQFSECDVMTEIEPQDISTICYTSGTTGHPKGAVLSHESILTNVAMTATMHVRNPSDVVVSALPLSHVYGNVVMNAAMGYGMTLVLHATFDAECILESIQEQKATIFEGVPTMYMYLLDFPGLSNYNLDSVQRCTVGGQTMPESVMLRVEEAFGCRVLELWGMTELGGLGATHSLYGRSRPGSIGVPLPHVSVRVAPVIDSDQVIDDEGVGELQIRGPIVMNGYLGRSEATREAITPDGWLRTGDLARIDSDGFIYIVDRLKDMIITAGFKVYPAELERVIAEHPGVAMVAVAGVPDTLKGELAKAYIVPKSGMSIDMVDLERHCRSHLAAYKVPRLYQVVDHLPKTSSGKVMRRLLATLFKCEETTSHRSA